jgi:protease secretion system membrane fusion protein
VKGDLSLRASNLIDSQTKLADIRERIKAVLFELERLEIKSPIKGVVMNSQFFTLGGVVPPGGRLLEILPSDCVFEVEILIPVNLIDKASVGNEIELTFPSLNRSVTPRLKGRLMTISADRIEDSKQPNNVYFKAKAIFEDQQIRKNMNIKIGMPVQTFIKTGNRSLLNYLLKPLIDRIQTSLI